MSSGRQGEIVVRGHNLFEGYYEDPNKYEDLNKNAETVEPDGWFPTGDVGSLGRPPERGRGVNDGPSAG